MNIPKHIAIIMDGNGRWATERGMPRMKGHQEGLKAAKEILKYSKEIGIEFVTLYVFSTENNNRSPEEVNALMNLLDKHLTTDVAFYQEHQAKVLHIGDLSGLPGKVQKKLVQVQETTKNYNSITVILAINYGGRDEIIRTIKRTSEEDLKNLNEQLFSSLLDTKNAPPVDLLIRTGAEFRISNFLLWQSAYAELYFSNKYWPDWSADDLKDAITEYQRRNRRFGREK